MTPFYSDPLVMLYLGDCLEVMPQLEADSVDSIVTDPPYGLSFMGKHWDYGVPGVDFWREMYRVLKPGGYLLSFAGTRTVHRFGVAIEDAGFEIRDTLMWIYASGFPKSLNLNGDRQGWGTALKPAHEPIVMARKPLIGTVAQNVTRYGTGALNIDGSRIGTNGEVNPSIARRKSAPPHNNVWEDKRDPETYAVDHPGEQLGRWPSNVLLSSPELFDEPNPGVVGSGAVTQDGTAVRHKGGAGAVHGIYGKGMGAYPPGSEDVTFGGGGGYSRFFLIPKADRAERERGLAGGRAVDAMGLTRGGPGEPGKGSKEGYEYRAPVRANVHPTVKPIDLMRHLVRLVTPPGGVVLDPFVGSGTTCLAASELGFRSIGIEREAEYMDIAVGRLMATGLGLGL